MSCFVSFCAYTHTHSADICFIYSISLQYNITSIEIVSLAKCCKSVLSHLNYAMLKDLGTPQGTLPFILERKIVCFG